MSVEKHIHRIIDRTTIHTGWQFPVLFLFMKCLFAGQVCFAALPAAAEQPALPDGVEIQIRANPQTAAVGDRIQIDLDISAPVGWRIDTLEPEQQTDDFFILEFHPGPVIDDTNEDQKTILPSGEPDASLQTHRARIITAVYRTGTFTFPGVRVFLTDREGVKTEVQSPAIDIEIQSILTGDDSNLKELKKQADIPEKVRWLLWILIVAGICILGAAAWLIMKRYRQHPDAMPVIPEQNPFDLAESDLRDLIARELPEKGHTKKFYVLLSEIVKRILEAAYDIHTVEQTTPEIMTSLQRTGSLKKDHLNTIESLLIQCDMVKFAKYIPSGTENSAAAESAFRILSEARNSQQFRVSEVESSAVSSEI